MDVRRIDIVEDNADNRLLLRVLLGDDHAVREFADGSEALAAWAGDVPELVLLDISLPRMDGVEVLRRMRGDERLRDVPVIAFTAHAKAGDRETYLAAGFDGYVSKPILDERVLVDAIEQALSARSRRD
jgi:CheY-like chemotaxis protein